VRLLFYARELSLKETKGLLQKAALGLWPCGLTFKKSPPMWAFFGPGFKL